MQVIVVGGGVAGTVTAIALRQRGIDVTLFEAYADPGGDVGSFVSLAANGLRGLASIACLDRVRAEGVTVDRQRLWAGSGQLLGDVARGRVTADPLHSATLMRAQLVAQLRAAATEAGVPVITGERLVDAVQGPDEVRVRFASGRTASADLLVGADGMWSVTRSLLDPLAPRPTYAGLYTVSGISTGVDDAVWPPPSRREVAPAAGESVFNLLFGRNGTFIYLRLSNGEVWWQAEVSSPAEPVRDGVETSQWRRRLLALYEREPRAAQIIQATTTWHRPTLHHRLAPVPTWYAHNAVLVGDAAHPVAAGQGAAMAIEDGLILAAALAGAPSIPAALAGYHRIRQPRVARMLKASDDNRDRKKAGPVRRSLERAIMPIVLRHFYANATAWLYTYDIEAHGPAAFATPSAR